MPDISVNGISLHYERAGAGPPLLLIAGLASDSASWAPVAPLLAARADLIMPDNRGSGRTNADGAAIGLDAIAADCAALLDHLEIGKIDVLGHSMGGVIAMILAAERPHRVGKLIVAATAPVAPARTVSIVDTLTALRESGLPEIHWYRSFFHWLFRPGFFDDKKAVDAAIAMARAYPYAQTEEDMRRQVEASRAFDGVGLPARIAAPTLVLAGAEDLMFPTAGVEAAFGDLQNRRIKVLPDAGHSLHWDQPRAFAEAVLDFLRPEKTDIAAV